MIPKHAFEPFQLLIDLDDVLADCTGDAMRHMGLHDWKREDHAAYPYRDIIAMYAQVTGIKHEVACFWEHFKREFWAGLTPLPWCYELLDLVQEYVPRENIAILTSPTKCGDCLAGKLDWIADFMPSWLHRQYLMSPRKKFCAHKQAALIDDADENIIPFETAGGTGIVMPQHWNSCADMVGHELEFVKKQLDNWRDKGYCSV